MNHEAFIGTSLSERARPLAHGRGDFWAITCYFNPIGYRRRLENYYTFRQHLAVPLLTVELSFDADFQLQQHDADVLVQLRGGSVMWQKERLLNVALKLVPDTCDYIAWLDCDVVFELGDWVERARRALDQFALLRLFHKRHDLSHDASVDHVLAEWARMTGSSLPDAAPIDRCRSPGLAWASRRDLLEKHGLYDACILGSGDKAILYAALGQFDDAARVLRLNARRLEHYLAWAKPFFGSVHHRVGCLHGRLVHLWHGERNDRDYRERHRLLEAFDFDPTIDIAVDCNGTWRWNSNKRNLHESIRSYFRSRQEDGVAGT
jgi:hypothetical protein